MWRLFSSIKSEAEKLVKMIETNYPNLKKEEQLKLLEEMKSKNLAYLREKYSSDKVLCSTLVELHEAIYERAKLELQGL